MSFNQSQKFKDLLLELHPYGWHIQIPAPASIITSAAFHYHMMLTETEMLEPCLTYANYQGCKNILKY